MRAAVTSVGAVCALQSLAGCGGGATTPAAGNTMPAAAGLTAVEIAQRIYDDQPRTPAGFYREPDRDPRYFYATFHLTNTRLDPATEADLSAPEFELCASSRAEADAWEQTDRNNHAPSTQVLSSAVTDALYEYERDVPGADQRREVVRLFQCSFIDRSGVNLRAPNGYGGRLNNQPVAAADLRYVAEYLWTFSSYNNVGNAVLESRATAGSGTLLHELTQAELQRGMAGEPCDRLNVFTARYTLQTASADVSYGETTLWSIDVRLDGGRANLCG